MHETWGDLIFIPYMAESPAAPEAEKERSQYVTVSPSPESSMASLHYAAVLTFCKNMVLSLTTGMAGIRSAITGIGSAATEDGADFI